MLTGSYNSCLAGATGLVLINMQNNTSMIIPFGIFVGILSAVDYGGPINKVVFVFSCGVMAEGIGGPIAILMQTSMIAPFGLTIGYFLSKIMKRDIFSKEEVDNLKSAFIMGCCMITEGSYPIILNDLIRITICTGVGAGVGGAVCAALNVTSKVPTGGLFALPGFNHPQYWLFALLIGSCVFAILLQFLKRKPVKGESELEEKEIDLASLKIS